MPQDWYVLVDGKTLYLYMDTESMDTYIQAIRLDSRHEYNILHYRYVLDWVKQPPSIRVYPPTTHNVIEILNYIRASL